MERVRSAHLHPALRPFVLSAIVLALVVGGSGLALAIQTSDTAEMDLSILPVENTAVPAKDHSLSQDTDRPAGPRDGIQPLNGVVGRGAVTALINIAEPGAPSSRNWLSFETTVIVSDTRGTAEGWAVVLSATTTQTGLTPVLIRNPRDTISEVAPAKVEFMAQERSPVPGRSLGPLIEPTRILYANSGSGDGIFRQRLIIAYPVQAESSEATMDVCLPFGP